MNLISPELQTLRLVHAVRPADALNKIENVTPVHRRVEYELGAALECKASALKIASLVFAHFLHLTTARCHGREAHAYSL
jgi:hypothetical protein